MSPVRFIKPSLHSEKASERVGDQPPRVNSCQRDHSKAKLPQFFITDNQLTIKPNKRWNGEDRNGVNNKFPIA
ncbi:hypothetical protein ACTXT7_009067 [Hymenolepis weldensis]